MTCFSIRTCMFISLSPLAFVAQAAAQTADQPRPALAQAEPEATIVVTGTRRTDRTVADSPVPVDVISADTLANSGHTELNRALTQEVPSFNFPQPSITDGTDVIRPATLRGLGPDQTLVLINGKRRHTSALLNINGSVGRGTAAVDINLIPAIALARVEVLRDGAAAQYGSDAIAGVINMQLRNARSGGEVSITYGQYFTHVDDVETVDGVPTLPGNLPVLAPDGTLQLDLSGKDRRRRDGETLTIAGVVAFPIGEEGSVNLAAEFQDRNDTNRTGADPRRQYSSAGALDPRELTFDRFSHRYGDPETRDTKLFLNADLPVGGDAEIYAFASYNDRQGESAGFYRIAQNSNNIPAIYPDGFLPLITTDTDDYSGTLGVRGDLGGWRWDVSGQYGRDKVDFLIKNTLNRTLGPTSPTEFDSGGLRYSQAMANFDVSRDFALGFAAKTSLSLGAEYRRETFDIRPGEPDSFRDGGILAGSPGAQVFPGFQPVIAGQKVDGKKSRENASAYVEIDSDINDRFNIQAALRIEDYSDFGSDLNWKLASRFEPIDGVALRGSISTGFRAPSLQQQFFAAQATNLVNGFLVDAVTLPVGNPAAIALGAKPLDAEQSTSLSGGLVLTAVPRLNVTVDAYRVDIDDRIVITENLGSFGTPQQQAAVKAILAQAGFGSVAAARFFVNGVDTRTKGLDIVATWRPPVGDIGRLSLTAGANFNRTKIRRNAVLPGELATIPDLVLFGRQESLRLEKGQPRNKFNFSANFERDWFETTFRATRYGDVLAAGTEEFFDIDLNPKTITDVEFRFKPIGDRLTLAFGGNNIFDVYPTNTPRGRGIDPVTNQPRNFSATNYATPFSSFSPFGFNGRFLYGRINMSF